MSHAPPPAPHLPPEVLAARVVTWQRAHGRHHLPWQTGHPYHVWVSEVMLQQTQVQTVLPYFKRFMARFPDPLALANASRDDVLAHWSGLGYYRRAERLHAAAQHLRDHHHGNLPSDLEALMTLPGVGRSTAGAIRSLGFNQPAPILDGNVKRVLARLHNLHEPVNHSRTERWLWSWATHYTPSQDAATYTQGLMDLGAMVCTPHRPACGSCPCADVCLAKAAGQATELPIKTVKKPSPTLQQRWFWIHHDDHVLLVQRPEQGIWANLWTPPLMPKDTSLQEGFAQLGLPQVADTMHAACLDQLPPITHTFSHQRWVIAQARVVLEQREQLPSDRKGLRWYAVQDIDNLACPGLVKQWLQAWSSFVNEGT